MDQTLHDRIVETSYEMFLERGIKIVTMDAISKELGISKRTLYEEFPSKLELIESVFNYRVLNSKTEYLEIVKGNDKILEKLFKVVFMNAERKEKETLFMEEIGRLKPGIFKRNSKNLSQMRNLLTALIREGVKEGIFIPNLDFKMITNLYINMIIGKNPDVWDKKISYNMSKREMMSYSTVFFFRGISTIKGIEEIEKLCKLYNVNIFSKS